MGHAMGPQWYRRVVEPSDVIYGKWGLPNRDIGSGVNQCTNGGSDAQSYRVGYQRKTREQSVNVGRRRVETEVPCIR